MKKLPTAARRHRRTLLLGILAALLAVCLLAGCSAGGASSSALPASAASASSAAGSASAMASIPPKTPGQPAAGASTPSVYFIPFADIGPAGLGGVVVDENGRVLVEGEYLNILYDVVSGLPQAIEQRFPKEQAQPDARPDLVLNDECEASLYGLDGEVLRPRSPGIYKAGTGRAVVHASLEITAYEVGPMPLPEEFSSALVDKETGETLLESAYSLSPFQEDSLLVGGGDNLILGIVNHDLKPVGNFPMPQAYAYLCPFGENYLATTVTSEFEDTGYLLDASFAVLASYPGQRLTETAARGDGCIVLDITPEEPGGIPAPRLVNAATGEDVIDLAALGLATAFYYDGDYVMGVQMEDTQMRYQLYTAAGAPVLRNYKYLTSKASAPALQTQQFYGYKDENTLQLLSREGEVLAEADCPGDVILYFGQDSIMPTTENRVVVRHPKLGSALFSEDLQPLVPQSKYNTILPMDGTSLAPAAYFIATRKGDFYGDGIERSDILDMDGNIVLEAVDSVHYQNGSAGRFVVEKDGNIGLMDTQGNWLYQAELTA